MRQRRHILALILVSLIIPSKLSVAAEPIEFNPEAYTAEIRPLMAKYCVKCHSANVMEADINLTAFTSIAEVRKQPEVWIKVNEVLESGQMPPKDEPQLTNQERIRLENWVRAYLKAEAKSQAGDPGRVVLRRLNNVEYTNTIRDLTQIASLQPAREFPIDSAAGEGFTNLGNALVMSPALVTKYFDAAKEIASHAVLLPKGFQFSRHTSSRDWTDERVAAIRSLYSRYTDADGGSQVNLQGIVFNTNADGRLPVEKYLQATLLERDRLTAGDKSIKEVAQERGLSPKYLSLLWQYLNDDEPTFLLDRLRSQWVKAEPEEVGALAEEIGRWQKSLWRFTSVGHIGKANGPKAWMEPVTPIAHRIEIRQKIAPPPDGQSVMLYLTASDAGDGNDDDYVLWQQPRLVKPGRPDLLLRDLRAVLNNLSIRREKTLADTVKFLTAAAEASVGEQKLGLQALADKHQVDVDGLSAWLNYLGIGTGGPVDIASHFNKKIDQASGYDFVSGWGDIATPFIVANSSDTHVRIPGNLKPHSVAVHPSPTLDVAIGWRSPISGAVHVEAIIQHAHPECGNGITWSIELRRGAIRRRLASGIASGQKRQEIPPIEQPNIKSDDVISVLIGPREGNHSCDLTAVDLKITSIGDNSQTWSLADDVSSDIRAANPHPDRFDHAGVWSFYTEPATGGELAAVIPADSLLAKWDSTSDPAAKQNLAQAVLQLLTGPAPTEKDSPDAKLYRQLTSLSGPLFASINQETLTKKSDPSDVSDAWGVDSDLFGRHPNGDPVDAASLCVQAPTIIDIKLPVDFSEGWEFVTTGTLHPETGTNGTVQLYVATEKPEAPSELVLSQVTEINKSSQWTDNKRQLVFSSPIIVLEGSEAEERVKSGLQIYRNLFPAALCYSRIIPVDEVVTLTLFYREDVHLMRLMLDEAEIRKLNDLWSELHFVSRDALTLVDAFKQLMEYASQDGDPKVFEPLRRPIYERARAFIQELQDAEPKQLEQLAGFASKAYRRPLSYDEVSDLRGLYIDLRDEGISHDEAFRLTLARILIAPAFLYRAEPPMSVASSQPAKGATEKTIPIVPVDDWALASRISYFLWATMPDDELFQQASAGKLHEPEILAAQAHRMLKDLRVRMLATEFACQWLHVRDFDSHNEKSEQAFPTFSSLRGDMYEETVQFFADLFQRDGSVLEILNADHTFLNESLAKHYAIPDVAGPEWRRVDHVKQFGRGGILTFATTLATQSGASRTSPVLRGNWVLESLLGEKLPRPPKNVPPLPETETDTDLTVRQLVEAHRSIESCAHCHERIDSFGFSLESYDAIGRRRDKDLGGHKIDVDVQLKDGTRFSGAEGLRDYLIETRRTQFLRNFCKKLLGYALARGVQLSDEPLLDDMMVNLKTSDYRFSSLVETIIRSQQFRYQQAVSRE